MQCNVLEFRVSKQEQEDWFFCSPGPSPNVDDGRRGIGGIDERSPKKFLEWNSSELLSVWIESLEPATVLIFSDGSILKS